MGFAACAPDTANLRWDGGSVSFKVELRDTPETRATGMMHRDSLGQFAGMLFAYKTPQTVAFWMRNTLIPLDMIFMDKTGTVTRIHQNAVPLDETVIPGGSDVQYVLEVNGGISAKLGLKTGAILQHTAINTQWAAWPCP